MAIFVLSLPIFSVIKQIYGYSNEVIYSEYVNGISMPTIIQGTVYREFKFNGIADASDNYRFEELGIGGVTINVYDDDLLLIGTVVTTADGSWSFDAASASGPQVLVEYIIPSGFDSGPSGDDNKSDLVKVTVGSSDNNFTIGKLGEHCQDNPTIATACFPGPTTPSSTIVTIEYEDSENFTADQNSYSYPPNTANQTTAENIAFESETGFISGLAWDKTHNSIYSASFVKLTSKGTFNNVGNIYKTVPDGASGTTTLWLDLESIFPNIAGGNLFMDGTATTGTDPDAHNIGHIGFTDIEISADDSEVYVFNSKNRKIYIIPVDQITGNPLVSLIDSVQIPAICSGMNSNGFSYSVAGGIGVFDGKVYASTTCTGPSISDLKGAIYSFDPSSPTPTVSLEFELDYANWIMPDVFIGGDAIFTSGVYLNNVLAPWSTGLSNVNPALFGPEWISGTGFSDFAPWAMDIEFDIHPNGNVGMNIITKNRGIDATETFNDPTNGGFMSKASLSSSGSWILENNGETGPFETALDKNTPANAKINIFQRGQPDAKFYHGEGLEGPSANGGAVIIPGFKEIMTSNTDNVLGNYDSGFSFHDVSTGLKTRYVNLLQGGNVGFAKGNSWGDLQALVELPPIEIGNYVWLDADNDGIQDPSEKAQPGVSIEIWKDTDSDNIGDLMLGTAISDAQGFYYFGGVGDANVSEPLAPFMTYELRTALSSAKSANSYISDFTVANNTSDKFDSDFVDTLINGQAWAYTTVTTSNTDLVFHEYDLGFYGECSVEINNFAINSCTPNGSGHEATLNFEVVYNFAPIPGENLFIEVDGISISGSPFLISPNDCDVISVSMPIPADGSIGHNINAYFETTNTCSDQILDIKYPSPCPSDITLDCSNKVSGVVFIDTNFDGLNNDNSGNVEGVKVTAYDCENNFVGSTFSDAEGEYLIQETTTGVEYRLEFTFTDAILCNYKPTVAGPDSKTTIQFVEPGTCANLGLADPNACLTPKVAVVCFARNNDAASEPTIVIVNQDDARTFPASQNANDSNGLWGIPTGANAGNYPITHDEIANVGEISTTFGMEWDSKNSQLYTGTYIRAFAPVKTDGSTSGYAEATIYAIPVDVNEGVSEDPEVWLNLEDLFGDDFAGSYLPDVTYPGPEVYGRTGAYPNIIGYTGLGSVKISKDNSELYVVNLKSREVLVIPIDTDGSAPTNASEIKRFPLPNQNCSGSWGDGRPYSTVLGLGVHPKTGKVYASATCSGPTANDLMGYVYSFDPKDSSPSSSDFSLELSIPLNIERPATSPNTLRFWGQTVHPWESVSANTVFYTNDPRTGFGLGNEFNVQHNQPWLGEIGFDNLPNGECGMIVTERNRYHDLINGSFYVAGGVVFRACGEEGNWTLENNGQCGSLTSNVNFSFGGTNAGDYTSQENRFFMYVGREGSYSAGTLTINGEGDEVILPVLDNLFNSATSGITWLNTEDGSRSRDIRILGDFTGGGFNNTNFTKSNNWGAIATMCVPPPIEIGNYVWLDENNNGVQDACEVGIEGIAIELYQGSELIGTTTTDANGEYYFNHTNVDTLDFENSPTEGFTGLSANTNYTIQIQIDCGPSSSSTKYVASPKDAGSGDNQDFIDSDVMKVGSVFEIDVLTTEEGCSIHTLDAGFYEIKTCEIESNSPICFGDPINISDIGEAGESWSWTGPDEFISSDQNPNIATSSNANEGTYNLVITDFDNCTYACSVEIMINEITPDVDLMPTTICAESQYGVNSVDLNTLISTGPSTGTWSDTDNTGGLIGNTFTANASHRGNSYSFTYTLNGEGPSGTACDDRSFTVEVNVIDCRLDLALRKTVNDGPYSYGDTLTYNIEVFNQGAISVSHVAIYDTIPCGLLFDPSLNVGWTYNNNIARDTLTDVLLGNSMVSRELRLIIQKCAIPDASNYYNSAEIYDFKDENGDVSLLEDNDSDPDDEVGNDGTPIDDEVTDPNDEDDQDFENISICDLALTNTIVEIPSNPSIGDTVKFEVIIYNQGNKTANSVNVDYLIPNGYKYLPINDSLTPIWNEENVNLANIVTNKIIHPNENDTLCLYLKIDNVPTSEVTLDSWTTIAEITSFTDENDILKTEDVDSKPDNNFYNDPGGNPDDDTDNQIDGSGDGDPEDPNEDNDPTLDEDDNDPTIIYVCDVAAIIDTEESGPFAYGDTLKYYVEVHNQGNGNITNVSLQNLYGEGLEYIDFGPNSDAGWSMDSIGVLSNIIDEIILPNDTINICLYMKLIPHLESTEESWLQNVEVVSFEDPDEPGISKHDLDSTPDDDPTNDPGGNPDDDTDDETTGDGSGDPNDPDDNENPDLDEDDQDTEDIEICDLALKNSIEEIPLIPEVGDTVKYEVVIYNQGNTISNSVSINYSLPVGLKYLPVNDDASPKWENPNSELATLQTDKVLNPGESDTLCLYLEIDNVSTGEAHPEAWMTQAEIIKFTDENNNPKLEDIDSNPDTNFSNDPGGNPDDDTDDIISGNGTGDADDQDEDSNPDLDEDDHDPTIIYLCDAAAIIYTLDDSEHSYGDTIKYTIEVHNQGSNAIQNTKIQNLFGEGFIFPDSELNLETGWFLEEDGQVSLIIDDIVSSGDTITECIEMILVPDHNSSDSSWLQQIEIVRFEDPSALGVAKNDIDSSPDDMSTNDPGGNSNDETDDETDGNGMGDPDDEDENSNPDLDEDDHDPVDTKVFDLALKMQIDSMPPVLPVVPGDVMKFIVVVYNQGNTPANNIELTNYIMDNNLFLNSQSKTDGWDEISSTKNEFIIVDELLPGETDTTCIYLQLINGAMSDIITWAEVSGSDETDGDCYDIDSKPNDINGDDVGGETTDQTDDHIIDDGTDYNNDGVTDEDDHDPAMLTVQDLALIVWADQKDPVVPGDDVKFIIRVINQGNVENHNIKIADYIPQGFELSENDTNNWSLQSDNIYTKTLSEPLQMGDTIETCIILKVKEGVDAYDLINYAEVVTSTDNVNFVLDDRDVDSTPDSLANNDSGGQYSDLIDCETFPVVIGDDNNTSGAGKNDEDEDDHDPAWVPVLDLASIIYTEHTQPLIPGDDIKFLVDIINQGNMATENIGLTIYVPAGFYLSPEDSNGWMENSENTLTRILSEPLLPLEQKQLCLILRVNNDFSLEDLIPFVEINSVMDTLGNNRDDFDLDSDPDFNIDNDVNGLDDFIAGNGMEGSDEDDHDPVVPPIMDLAIKIINTDPSPKVPGDLVKFQVSLYNQGSMTPSFFSIENYLPEGLIFNESPENMGWEVSGINPVFEYTEKLLPSASDTICIWLEVAEGAHPLNVTNMVEITSIIDMMDIDVSDRDIDSVSDDSNENDKGNDLYSAEDNKLEENGRSGDDEDDHDQAFVLLCQDMICISSVNISLDENCEVELSPGMFLKSDLFPPELYEYTYIDDFGQLQNIDSFNISDVDKMYTLKISNPICANSCWSEVSIEYKLPPQIDCPEDLTISCGGLDVLGLPIAEAACAGLAFEVTLHNEVRERLDCDPEFTHRIQRTYRATDERGNFAECSHEIMLERVDLTGIMFPEWRTQSTGNAISCSSEGFIFDESGYPLPWLNSDLSGLGTSGVPFVCDLEISNGVFCPLTGSGAAPLIPIGGATTIDEDGNVVLIEGEANQFCNSAIFYTDIEQFSNTCIRKIIRTWEVREWWCSGETSAGGIQMIEVIDDQAPTFTCPDNFTVTTNDDCAGSVVLDSIVAMDNCMNGIIVSIDYPNGLLKTNGGVAELDTGLNMIKYIVADGCYNKDSCYMQVTVIDETEPVAICEQNTAISISPNGMTEVFAEVFDDGSWDECSPVRFEVRRMDTLCVADDTLFDKSITFCCLDVPNDDLMVIFRAYDNAGNFNDCMVNVDVQDKVPAIMTCPDDQYIDCREPYDIANLSLLFGEPDITDNCANTQIVNEYVDTDSIDQCGLGKIIRRFELMDDRGITALKTCKQIINIENASPFIQDSISWPGDVILPEGCNADDAHPEDLLIDDNYANDAYPIINGDDSCSLIGWDWDDRVISLSQGLAGECVVIERTWTVINWCGATSGTFETFVIPSPQIITVRSTKKPVFDSIVNGELVSDSILIESINIDCESGLIRIERTASDECSQDDLIWSYMIRDEANTVVARGDTNVILDTLTNGLYTIDWTVTNQCHFEITDTQIVEVVNLKAPTPVCRYGMNITLTFDNTGGIIDETAEVWASDLDAGSYHSCGNPIQISLSQDSIQLNKKFTCADIGEQVLQLWVRDTTTGVQDFCTSLITVTDNGDCPDMNSADIQGKVYTESLEMVENVEVTLKGSEEQYITQSNGEYQFNDMPMGGSYIVNPSKDINHLEGISTLDLILIQRHILGLQKLDSPYKLIAADIDKSDEISVIDLLELRKLILGINSVFPENESWRFVDAEHKFLDSNNPWVNTIPEDYEIDNLSKNMDVDFIGIKTGDVNGSIINGSNKRSSSSDYATVRFNYSKTNINKASKVIVPIYASNYTDVSGWQATFNFDTDKLEIVDVVSGELDLNNHFYLAKQNEGWFTFSYHKEESQTVSEDDILFSIVVKAKEDIVSEKLFELSSKAIKPEAYTNFSNIVDLELNETEQPPLKEISVYPNPWNERTLIEFSQPIDGETTFKFYNSNGQLIYSKTKFYEKGIQKLKVERNDIKSSGMVFVVVSNGYTSSEFKMMIIH